MAPNMPPDLDHYIVYALFVFGVLSRSVFSGHHRIGYY